MAVKRIAVQALIEVDTSAKTVAVLLTIPAADGEGDVVLFRQNVTASLSADDRRKLRNALSENT